MTMGPPKKLLTWNTSPPPPSPLLASSPRQILQHTLCAEYATPQSLHIGGGHHFPAAKIYLHDKALGEAGE